MHINSKLNRLKIFINSVSRVLRDSTLSNNQENEGKILPFLFVMIKIKLVIDLASSENIFI